MNVAAETSSAPTVSAGVKAMKSPWSVCRSIVASGDALSLRYLCSRRRAEGVDLIVHCAARVEVLEVVARANYIGHRRVGRAVARF